MAERDVDIRVLSQQDNPAVGEQLIRPPVATRDGAIFTADWFYKQLLRGRIHQVAGGATNQGFTDPATWGAGSLDSQEFDLLVEVPLKTVIVPLAWEITVEKFGTTSLLEILLAFGTAAVSGGTDLTLVPVNQNSGAGNKSALTNHIVANAAAAGTGLTKEGEIWRGGLQLVEDIAADDAAAWPNSFSWKATGPGDLYVIEGPKFIAGYIASQAGQGFQKFTWAEFETGEDIG